MTKFIDKAKIFVKSGDGGSGISTFRRAKYIEFGGPDGGNGGRGGNVCCHASSQINNLLLFNYKKHFKAGNGGRGGKNRKQGASGQDIMIELPFGTRITYLDKTVDLLKEGQTTILASGGNGGIGNAAFKNSIDRVPKFFFPGNPGQELEVQLSLMLLADIGIVGMPNIGKSTFLSQCSNALPTIADYSFTTLVPVLGVVSFGDFDDFIMLDIPGIVYGAHQGRGLGLRFLKHLTRCKLLVHMIDITSDSMTQDYRVIRDEIRSFDAYLLSKISLVLLSKSDSVSCDVLESKKKELMNESGLPVFCTGYGFDRSELLLFMIKNLFLDASQKKYAPV